MERHRTKAQEEKEESVCVRICAVSVKIIAVRLGNCGTALKLLFVFGFV